MENPSLPQELGSWTVPQERREKNSFTLTHFNVEVILVLSKAMPYQCKVQQLLASWKDFEYFHGDGLCVGYPGSRLLKVG